MLISSSPRKRRHHVASPVRDERGMATLQMAILTPLILIITFTGVQAALYYYARNVATAAAQVGVEAARTQSGSSGDGHQAAGSYLANVGGSLMKGSTVQVTRGAAAVTVRVTVPVPKVVPGLPLKPIDTRVTGAVERTTQP